MIIMDAKDRCKDYFGQDFNCIFTPSCSYALNLAIRGVVTPNMHVLTTYLEHNSVLRVLEELRELGIISYTVLDSLTEENIVRNIKKNTKLFVSTHISNVTGEKTDLQLISKICNKYKIIFLLDSAQGAGHIIDDYLSADMIAFAGHKGFKSLIGIGGLMIKNNVKLRPLIYGGTGTKSLELKQPSEVIEDYEVGSQPGVLIAGLDAGIKYSLDNQIEIVKKEKFLTNYLIGKLNQLDFIDKFYNANNCHSVVSFNMKNIDSSLVADILGEEHDICVRSGFHCAPLVHYQFGTQKTGMVRVSLNEFNTCKDIDDLVDALKDINIKIRN